MCYVSLLLLSVYFILTCTVSVPNIIDAQNSFGSVNTDLYCFPTDGFRNASLLQTSVTFTEDVSVFLTQSKTRLHYSIKQS